MESCDKAGLLFMIHWGNVVSFSFFPKKHWALGPGWMREWKNRCRQDDGQRIKYWDYNVSQAVSHSASKAVAGQFHNGVV